jgi:hypothetical protein
LGENKQNDINMKEGNDRSLFFNLAALANREVS